MARTERYFWIKLPEDFFRNDIRIRRLRNMAGGDTFIIIYLKLLLLTINTEGVFTFEGVFDDIYDEIADLLGEESDNIRVTLTYLESVGYLTKMNQDEYQCTQLPSMVGSECDSAHRVRALRERQKELKTLHCNTSVTPCNTDVT